MINGADVRQLRNQLGFTLTYVAFALGTSTSKVSNIENSSYHDTTFTERCLARLNEARYSGVHKAA